MRDKDVVAVLPPEWLHPFSMEDRLEQFRPSLKLENVKLEPPEVLVWMPPVDMPPLKLGPLCSANLSLDDEYSVAPRRTNTELLIAMMEPTVEIGGESFAIPCHPSWAAPSAVAVAIEQMAKEKGWR